MAWPPRDQPGPGQQPANGPDLTEDIPAVFATGYRNIVHLDLDPQNIFLESNDAGFHNFVPRLQLGDFGNAVLGADLGYPAPGFQDLDEIWRARQLGKDGWYLPEQFTAEWDYVNYEPYSEGFTDLNAGTGTAGLFSEKSNIWAVGLVMRCCITRSQPETPPLATPVPPKGPQKGTQGYTYGGELSMRFFTNTYGQDLCRLVSRCLMHKPSDRPSLASLRQDIAASVAAYPLTEEDRQWVRTTLLGPGNPMPQYPISPTQGAGLEITLPF